MLRTRGHGPSRSESCGRALQRAVDEHCRGRCPSRMAFTHIGELTGHRGTHWHGAHLDVWGRLANRRGTITQRTVHMKPLRGMNGPSLWLHTFTLVPKLPTRQDAQERPWVLSVLRACVNVNTTGATTGASCVSVNVNTTDGTTVWSCIRIVLESWTLFLSARSVIRNSM